jgi:hypothetical protein
MSIYWSISCAWDTTDVYNLEQNGDYIQSLLKVLSFRNQYDVERTLVYYQAIYLIFHLYCKFHQLDFRYYWKSKRWTHFTSVNTISIICIVANTVLHSVPGNRHIFQFLDGHLSTITFQIKMWRIPILQRYFASVTDPFIWILSSDFSWCGTILSKNNMNL